MTTIYGPNINYRMMMNDETLPNFIERKHTRNGEKKKQRTRTKVQASKQPKRGMPQGGKGTTKHGNLHQSHEAYQLKKGEVSPITLQA
jgi:hypothetical protein